MLNTEYRRRSVHYATSHLSQNTRKRVTGAKNMIGQNRHASFVDQRDLISSQLATKRRLAKNLRSRASRLFTYVIRPSRVSKKVRCLLIRQDALGQWIRTEVPLPKALDIVTVPPCNSTVDLTIASPKPWPLLGRQSEPRNSRSNTCGS